MNTQLQPKTRQALRRLRRHARALQGTFTTTEAARHGLSRQRLKDLAARELVVRLERGIYSFLPFQNWQVDRFAAWRKIGPDSVLSHTSALDLWDLSDNEPRGYELTIPRAQRARARQHGPLFHLHTTNREPVVHWIEGVPVTSPARSIVDAAAGSPISGEQIEMAVAQAIGRGLATEEELLAEAHVHPGYVRKQIAEAINHQEEYAGYI